MHLVKAGVCIVNILGTEMGFYKDPYSLFGKLTYEMWRACRLVLDVALHTKGWTREQAVTYLSENTALSLHEVNTEINRYISWPGQALAYKIGELKIKELRKKAEDKLKDKFDIREFHGVVLSQGTVTLRILEQMVDKYIAEKLKNDKGCHGFKPWHPLYSRSYNLIAALSACMESFCCRSSL